MRSSLLRMACLGLMLHGAVTHADDAVLTLPGDAKGAAMGEAVSASASGAEGLWYNPAAISRGEARSLSAMHAIYLEKVSFSTLGVALPFGSQNAVAAGVSYLNAGSIVSYDNTGATAPSYSPKDMVGRLGIAKSIYGTSAGLSVFYLQSTLVETAAVYGVNLGLHQVVGPASLALVAENFGGKLKYRDTEEALPSRIKAGFSLRVLPMLMWNTDIAKPRSGSVWAGTGAEIKLVSGEPFDLSLRGGYNTRSTGDIEGLHGLSAGAGFGFSGSALNYAWVPFGDLGQTHRLSLEVQFGEYAFNPYSEREIRSQTLVKPSPKRAAIALASGKSFKSVALPVLPWKRLKAGWRTSKEKMIDLLAKDALCAGAGARALVTRTRGTVSIKPSNEEKRWLRARAGRYVFEGDMLRTDVNAVAHLLFANGAKAEVGANTIMKVKTNDALCERAVTSLEEGELYTVASEGKEMCVKTPLGDASVKDAHARVSYDGKTVTMRVQYGSGTFTSDGVAVAVPANTTFAKTSEGRTQKTGSDPGQDVAVNITGADPRTTPGRWDPNFAKVFEREMMRLDSVPGLQLSEYVRDSSLRDQLKVKVFDMLGRRGDMESQVDGYRKDVSDFTERRDALRKALQSSVSTNLKELKLDLRQTNHALSNAQASLSGIQKELKTFLRELRANQEYLASIPIVRMLNITAQESTIPFATGRSVVPEESTAVLDSIAEAMVQMKPYRVVVEGHTDKTGSASGNRRLSKQRAEAVAHYLRKKTGLPGRMFLTKGAGAAVPLESGDSPESMAKNRRVEIWFELRGL